MIAGTKEGSSGAISKRPSRKAFRHLNKSDREMSCRRAVAET
jgi:hypothetical protein